MRFSRSTAAAAIAASLPLAFAQTSTDCNPTLKTCSSDTGLSASTYSADFTKGSSANASWSGAIGTTLTYGSDGAEFIISKEGQAPTIQTDFYIFFGRVDVKMKAATGTGIVSSIVLESDDLDEIDWEFLGGDTTEVETNFFGKGNTTTYNRAIYYPVSTPQATFHTYSIDWTSERIEFIIDGVTVRTLAYTDALTLNGANYPQTPMRLKLGNWCGGCSADSEGTIEWAGGNATFTSSSAYTMTVSSVNIQNYNPANSYVYGDKTGDWTSIKIVNGSSSASNTSTTTTSNGSTVVVASTAASTPTSSLSVAGVQHQTVAAVSTTVTGSSYSMNTASASAQNTGATSATTEVPSATRTSSTSTSKSTATGTSDASANTIMAASSLLSVALAFFML